MKTPSIIVRVDRRAEVVDDLRAEVSSLADTVDGLVVDFVSSDAVEAARDGGKFRDFVELARVHHEDLAVLEWVAEELVEEFGWLVDVGRPEEAE